MKNIFILFLFFSISLNAQEFKIAHNTGKIIIDELSNLKIKGYDGNEVIISNSHQHDHEENSRMKGLKIINSAGLDDNTGLGINVVKDGQNLKVSNIRNNKDQDITIKLPKSMGIDYSHKSSNGDHVRIEDIVGEIEISSNYPSIHLINVTGPMAVKAIYGSIEAVFSQVSQTGSITLNSVYDLVDITLPKTAKCNLSVSTPYGNIYSGVDIDVSKNSNEMRNVSSRRLQGSINGGGVDITLKSGYENVYIRN
jgi:hypothetical protein